MSRSSAVGVTSGYTAFTDPPLGARAGEETGPERRDLEAARIESGAVPWYSVMTRALAESQRA
jgi:hypothetical protein